MEFPEITTTQVLHSIPIGEHEKVAENEWNKTFRLFGNCEITSQKYIGSGRFDALVRYYDNDWDRYAWILVEYKRAMRWNGRNYEFDALCQLLMYLGNFFYDVSLEGTDNFAGIITASSDHFRFVPRDVVVKIMEEFEPVWKANYRVKPNEASNNFEIYSFVRSHYKELHEHSICVIRHSDPVRLDKIIKSIYEEWNLL